MARSAEVGRSRRSLGGCEGRHDGLRNRRASMEELKGSEPGDASMTPWMQRCTFRTAFSSTTRARDSS